MKDRRVIGRPTNEMAGHLGNVDTEELPKRRGVGPPALSRSRTYSRRSRLSDVLRAQVRSQVALVTALRQDHRDHLGDHHRVPGEVHPGDRRY